jgi:uncharacterized membrane protein YdfJ with MMPL/SSD domain
MARLLAAVADAAGRRRWAFVIVWVALFVLAGPFAGQVGSALSSGGFNVPGSQSLALVDYYNDLPGHGSQPFTLFVRAATAQAARDRLAATLHEAGQQFPQVHFTDPPQSSPDGRALVVVGYASLSQNAALKLSGTLSDRLQRTDGSASTYVLGPGATYHTLQKVITRDIGSAELIGLPVVAVVLIVLFGALVAALLPLALGALAVTITLACVYGIGRLTEISIYAESMASMIGLGVAVDYSLFILARFREELDLGADTRAATATAMRTSGTAVVFSGGTVIISLGTIWLVPVRAVQSMAAAAMLVVAVAVLAASTLLPALLHLLGGRVNALSLRRRRPLTGSGFWHSFSHGVMRRPVVSFVGAATVLIVLAIPTFWLRTSNTSIDQLPRGEAVVVGSHLLERDITGPGQGQAGEADVLVRPLGSTLAAIRPQVSALAQQIARDPRVASAQVQQIGGAFQITVPLRIDPESRAAFDGLVPDLRKLTAASPLRRVATVDVGGVSAFNRDLNTEISGDLWLLIVAILVLAYLLLLVLLRSVLLPLKAVLMNLLSIGAAYGVLVAVFQWGWFDWTGFHHLGFVSTLTPPLVLAITFGLSMDYEVFLLSRIKEHYDANGDNASAVADGLASTARIITSAAMIMVVVFAAFVITGVPAIKEIGLGQAVAIAVDATITRLILVPATMRLLGDWNWWLPAWLDRLLPHLAHEPVQPPSALAQRAR